ncbi:MAG: hypothetical protein HYT83_03595, partial [Candidatus Levybacteria bacterium]|nr:hypothetical protein [Candidatus Levybacteria bacterium]
MNPEMLRSVSMRFRAKPALAPLAVEPRDAHKFPRLVGGTTMVPGEVAVFERDVVYHHPFYEHRPNESIVMVNGQVHTLTREENLFLQSLEGGPNNIISFKELKLKTFGSEWYSDNYIKFIALNVRQKIEPNPHTPQIILTKKYEGYLLFDPNMLPPKDSEEVYAHADWTHYPKGHFIIMNGKIIILTSFENAILTVLEQTPNKAVQPFVFDEFFREHEIVESTEVHQAMYKLRRKIDPHSSTDGKSRYLVSSEFGYILIDPNKPDSNEAPTPRKGELVYAHLA